MAIETLQYVYQLSDFDTTGGNITPPNESGARAAGNPPFNIQLSTGASFFQIELDDPSNDGFDEVNGNSSDQVLTQNVTIDGTTFFAGTRIFVNYVLEDASGLRLYSITIGGSNTGNNATTAVITNQPLVPGQQNVFISENNIGSSEVPYSELACFVAGTQIATPRGDTAVEHLNAGDLVLAEDGREIAVRLALASHVDLFALRDNPRLRPVCILAGSLGFGLPVRDLWVSRQHRMLVASRVAERMFDVPHVLIPAVKLTALPGIFIDEQKRQVSYHHLVFDTHEIIVAEGAPTESLLVGARAQETMPLAQREELEALFPSYPAIENPAVYIPENKRQKALIARHAKNSIAPLQTFAA